MITYHIYKSNCFNSSRVMMQAKWDAKTIFFHRVRPKMMSKKKENDIKEKELGFISLTKALLYEKNKAHLIFHAQSSLFYLTFVCFFNFVLNKSNIQLTYDIHDLLERSNFKNLKDKVRYDIIRYKILSILESFIIKNKKVNIITVSKGLSLILAERYDIHPPSVVYNISIDISQKEDEENKEQQTLDKEQLLYFGSKKHSPVSLIPDIYKENLRLHMYGYNITNKWLYEKVREPIRESVKLYGPFVPNQLKFLSMYQILILYCPDSIAENYRIAMPNKVFQALYSGLSIIISGNFKEIKDTFVDVPGAVLVHEKGTKLQQTIIKLKAEREINYKEKILVKLDSMIIESKNNYIQPLRDKE